MQSVHLYSGCLLGLVAIIGDILVNQDSRPVYKAITDNATHAIIGGMSWFIVSLISKNRDAIYTILEIGSCTLLSSMIDLDHFWMAKSFSLPDATNLKGRPVLHCTTVALVLFIFLNTFYYITYIKYLQRISFIVLVAFLSHHTRDATRRGYWIYPFGSSMPLPYFLYISITIIIPFFVGNCMLYFNSKSFQYNIMSV